MKQISNLAINMLFAEDDEELLRAEPELVITSVEPVHGRNQLGEAAKEWKFEDHRFRVCSRQLREIADALNKYADQADADLERLTGSVPQ